MGTRLSRVSKAIVVVDLKTLTNTTNHAESFDISLESKWITLLFFAGTTPPITKIVSG